MSKLHSVSNTRARPGESVQDVIDRERYGEGGAFLGRIKLVNELIVRDKAGTLGGNLQQLILEANYLLAGILEKHKAKNFDGVRKDIETFRAVGFNVGIAEDNSIIYLEDLGPVRISWRDRSA